jgi:multisubunit Na+/H+ antiporter MnhB subunit
MTPHEYERAGPFIEWALRQYGFVFALAVALLVIGYVIRRTASRRRLGTIIMGIGLLAALAAIAAMLVTTINIGCGLPTATC